MNRLFREVAELGLQAVRATLPFKKAEGEKREMKFHYRGLPVWEAYLRVNLFSFLTSLSPSKTNKEPNSHAG